VAIQTGIGPAYNGFAITPSDDTKLLHITRGIYSGGGGDLNVELANGNRVKLVAILAGVIYPLAIVKVLSTGTGATDLIGLY
jgi:hypothetical protein